MKIALLQCNTVTGDIMGNARGILSAARKAAQEGASLCVTPELALCGVAPRDLLLVDGFVEGCQRALQWLAASLEHGPAVLVGAPVPNPVSGGRHVSNAAVLLQGGECSVVSRKVFFGFGQGASSVDSDARYFERGVSCGLMTLAGWRLGVVICEEGGASASFWKIQHANAHNPLMELVSRGVDGIIHMAASPCTVGRQALREHMYSHVAARHHVHLFSVNTVGGNDGAVYAGQSVAFGPTGTLLARGRAFEEDMVVVDTAVADVHPARLCADEEEECWRALVLGTRDYVRKSGASSAVVGLSGGMDSALVAAIAVEALGAKQVCGVLMPSPYTSLDSLDYARALAENLGIEHCVIPIESMMRAFDAGLKPVFAALPAREGDVTAENIQARIRGMLLMALANRRGSMVLNTGNKSESAMGYCTLYGDAVGALAVIGDVPKTFVYRVAQWYNTQFPDRVIPQGIIDRPPTAELRPEQLDSDALPPYDVLDPVVEHLMGQPAPLEEAAEHAIPPALAQRVFEGMRRSEFKRRQGPPALHISGRAFGEQWELPLVSRYTLPE